MPGKTSIAWADASWNPTTGCGRVSPGCDSCYAEALSLRMGWSAKPWTSENADENVILHPERLGITDRWTKPRRIFVNSMSDLFHSRVPGDFISEIYGEMLRNPRHTYIVLTKRPKRLKYWTLAFARKLGIPPDEVWPDWIWIGTSIESREYVYRADVLREVPAAVRVISAEPLLGPLITDDGYRRYEIWPDGKSTAEFPQLDLSGISWLIAGGESGPRFRPMDVLWAKDLQGACERSRTAFFMKQDSGLRPGQRGRIPNDLWVEEYPQRSDPATRVGVLFDV